MPITASQRRDKRCRTASAGRAITAAVIILLASFLPVSVQAQAPAAGGPLNSVPSALPVASEARLIGDQRRTRFVMDIDRRLDIAVSLLAEPSRVIVDLPETFFKVSPDSGREGRGLVSGFRFGQVASGKSRIVLDASSPVLIDKAFVLDPLDGAPARLVVDLVKTGQDEFLRAVRRSAATKISDVKDKARAGERGGATRAERPLVVLDPGHGGVDTGAVGQDATPEKVITLEMAKALKAALEASGQVRVILTREGDSFISLPDRVRFARERQAALFLSIHADSSAKPAQGLSGASVYTLSETASDEEAAAYAERENKADQIAGVDLPPDTSDVADILFDLMHRETKNFSVHFARQLVSELKQSVRLVKNPHRFAGFRVLRAPDVPSALLELGYLTNKDDTRLLNSQEWREKTAIRLAKAIISFVSVTVGRSQAP